MTECWRALIGAPTAGGGYLNEFQLASGLYPGTSLASAYPDIRQSTYPIAAIYPYCPLANPSE